MKSSSPKLSEKLWLQANEFLELDILDPKIVYQEGKDSLREYQRGQAPETTLVELTASDSIVFHPADILEGGWCKKLKL